MYSYLLGYWNFDWNFFNFLNDWRGILHKQENDPDKQCNGNQSDQGSVLGMNDRFFNVYIRLDAPFLISEFRWRHFITWINSFSGFTTQFFLNLVEWVFQEWKTRIQDTLALMKRFWLLVVTKLTDFLASSFDNFFTRINNFFAFLFQFIFVISKLLLYLLCFSFQQFKSCIE